MSLPLHSLLARTGDGDRSRRQRDNHTAEGTTKNRFSHKRSAGPSTTAGKVHITGFARKATVQRQSPTALANQSSASGHVVTHRVYAYVEKTVTCMSLNFDWFTQHLASTEISAVGRMKNSSRRRLRRTTLIFLEVSSCGNSPAPETYRLDQSIASLWPRDHTPRLRVRERGHRVYDAW